MLQRIQTVYLLVTFILTVLLFFLPMGFDVMGDGAVRTFELNAVGAYQIITDANSSDVTTQFVKGAWALFALVSIILGVTAYDILLFSRRLFQIRVAIFNMMLHLGIYALFAFYYFFLMPNQGVIQGSFQPNWTIVLPIVNVILTYLAIRAIGSDEALVRSLDRLR